LLGKGAKTLRFDDGGVTAGGDIWSRGNMTMGYLGQNKCGEFEGTTLAGDSRAWPVGQRAWLGKSSLGEMKPTIKSLTDI
jgi:hypothetical protein